jgi:hypothetical protein
VDAEVGVEGSRAFSPQSTLRGDFSAELGHTDSGGILDEQGILLPLSQTRALEGSMDVTWQAGSRTPVRIGARGYYTDFDDPELIDSSSARTLLSVGRSLSDHTTLTARYDFEFSRLGSSFMSHFGSLQWDHVLGKRSAMLLEGGVSYSDGEFESGLSSSWNPFGGASFARSVGRSRVLVFARREVVPAFGVGGLRLVNRFGVRMSMPVRRVQVDLDGSYVKRNLSADVPADTPDAEEAIAEGSLRLRKRLGERYIIGLQGRFRRQFAFGVNSPIDGILATIVLSFSNPGAGGI